MMLSLREDGITQKTLQLTPSWIEAYQKYHRFWLTLARSPGLSIQDSEDIVHGVVCSAIEKTGKTFESLEHIRNYVAKGVLNRVIQARQRADRHVPLSEYHESRCPVKLNDLSIDQERIHGLLRDAIRGLPDKDFEVLKLRFYVGLTFSEISQLLSIPMSTLKSREEAAVKKIRKWFRKHGV